MFSKKIRRLLSNFSLSRFKTYLIKRKNNVIIGKKSLVYYKSKVICTGLGRVIIGDNTMIGRPEIGNHVGMPFTTTLLSDGDESIIRIGDNCRINGAYIHAKQLVAIGNNCVIASGVNILDSNGHQVRSLNRTVGADNPLNIIIGNNVWIGLNAIILKGSVIGDNCIVAAGTVVKGNFPPNTIIRNQTAVVDSIVF